MFWPVDDEDEQVDDDHDGDGFDVFNNVEQGCAIMLIHVSEGEGSRVIIIVRSPVEWLVNFLPPYLCVCVFHAFNLNVVFSGPGDEREVRVMKRMNGTSPKEIQSEIMIHTNNNKNKIYSIPAEERENMRRRRRRQQ